MTTTRTDEHDEYDELIAAVGEQQVALVRLMARDRFAPLLQTQLTIQQLKLLLLVHIEGPQSGHDLAALLGVGTATVSGLVDRLVERGVLERREDPEDRRVRLVAPSPEGERLLRTMEDADAQMRARLLRRLDVGHLRHLVTAMRELTRIAHEEVESAAAVAAAAGDAADRSG